MHTTTSQGYRIIQEADQHAKTCRTLDDAVHEERGSSFQIEQGLLFVLGQIQNEAVWILAFCPFCGTRLCSTKEGAA